MEHTDNEQEIINQMSEGEMTYVEYIKQHDQSYRDEYAEFCKDNGYNTEDEDAAMAFVEYQEELLNSCVEY